MSPSTVTVKLIFSWSKPATFTDCCNFVKFDVVVVFCRRACTALLWLLFVCLFREEFHKKWQKSWKVSTFFGSPSLSKSAIITTCFQALLHVVIPEMLVVYEMISCYRGVFHSYPHSISTAGKDDHRQSQYQNHSSTSHFVFKLQIQILKLLVTASSWYWYTLTVGQNHLKLISLDYGHLC